MAAPRVPRLELDNERSRRRRSRSASGTHWAATSPAQGLAPHRPALRWPPGAPALLRAAGRRWSCLRPPEASRSPPRSAPAPQTPPRWLRFVDRAWEVPNFETRPASGSAPGGPGPLTGLPGSGRGSGAVRSPFERLKGR